MSPDEPEHLMEAPNIAEPDSTYGSLPVLWILRITLQSKVTGTVTEHFSSAVFGSYSAAEMAKDLWLQQLAIKGDQLLEDYTDHFIPMIESAEYRVCSVEIRQAFLTPF